MIESENIMEERYYKDYDKLKEAIEKGELYNYLTSTPHYRCRPELGMESVNDFTTVVENINYFLDNNPGYESEFYKTILLILKEGNFYEVFSVSNIIRKQYGLQLHKMTKNNIIDSEIFKKLKDAIIKYYNEFEECKEFTSGNKGMIGFYERWNEFLKENSNERIL